MKVSEFSWLSAGAAGALFAGAAAASLGLAPARAILARYDADPGRMAFFHAPGTLAEGDYMGRQAVAADLGRSPTVKPAGESLQVAYVPDNLADDAMDGGEPVGAVAADAVAAGGSTADAGSDSSAVARQPGTTDSDGAVARRYDDYAQRYQAYSALMRRGYEPPPARPPADDAPTTGSRPQAAYSDDRDRRDVADGSFAPYAVGPGDAGPH